MARGLSTDAHDKLLAAAQDLLVEAGIDGLTIDAVANRSGVAKTTIYRHFSNAHALAIAAVDAMIDPVPTPNTGSLRDDLLELSSRRLPLIADPDFRPMVLGLLGAAARDPEFAKLHESLKEQHTDPVRTVIELAMARGEIRSDIDIEQALALVEGPAVLQAMILGLDITQDDMVTFIDLAIAGLAAPDRRR